MIKSIVIAMSLLAGAAGQGDSEPVAEINAYTVVDVAGSGAAGVWLEDNNEDSVYLEENELSALFLEGEKVIVTFDRDGDIVTVTR